MLLTPFWKRSIDLSVASELHIVEPHWNPMVEAQAVDRVYRIGQVRPVRVTRYIVKDSVEEVSFVLLHAHLSALRQILVPFDL